MKQVILVLSLILVLINLESCKKDQTLVDAKLYNTWEVKEFISLQSVNYPKNKDNKILITFKLDGTYQLKLDVNNGSGTFTSNIENLINVEIPVLTEACCDSEFSKKFAAILPSVTSYSIKETILNLNVPHWGTIKLELVK